MGEGKAVNAQKSNPIQGNIIISMQVNGKPLKMVVNPTTRLVDILRDDLKLTGTKISCGIGRCGVCSVLINGHLVNACLVMAYQVDQSSITTIEGIGSSEDLHEIQEAFLEEGGFQCGYCTPGMIMAVKALLDQTDQPDEEQIKTALSGNLCRCTGYGGIIRAVQRLAAKKRTA